jgi:Type I phosphodiesterase / nucleotide pyrophosphatase
MQYVRMLTNSIVAGALAGAYVALLVLQLNPAVPLDTPALVRVVATWAVFYGIHAAVFFYVLTVIRQLIATEARSPAWLSLRLLAEFGTFAVSLAAVVTWLNLRRFDAVLGPGAAGRMRSGATALTVCAVLCGVLSVVQVPLERGRRIVAALFALVLMTSLILPIGLRGIRAQSPGQRVTEGVTGLASVPSTARVSMILLDGASLDYIAPEAAGGRVPSFGRLLESGAVMHLATLRPTQPAVVWTAVATGKLPYKTSVYSAGRYLVSGSSQRLDLLPDFCFAQSLFRFGLLVEENQTADAVKARTIWELVSGFGITTGVVDWPVTYPARSAGGYLVSDEFLRRDDPLILTASRDDPPLVSPPDVLETVRMARLRVPTDPFYAVDTAVEQIAHDLNSPRPAQFTAVRYPGLDSVGHYYLRYAMPRAFGDVSDEERIRYGHVLEQYYTYVDGIVGRAMDALGPDDLLLVVSGFGMEPLSFGKRMLERVAGDRELSGTHEGAPDGFLVAYGRGVAKGNFERASVVDVAPTVLYFLGLPIARDMDGFARTDIFSTAFTDQRPITFIPYYDR